MINLSSVPLQLSVLALMAVFSDGNYIITTPRKFPLGETIQICAFIVNSTSSDNSLEIRIESRVDGSEIIPRKVITIPPDKSEFCDKLTLPVLPVTQGRLRISGEVGGQRVHHNKEIKFSGIIAKTFVQTDKYLYKPGQEVQFRILTLSGPFLKISTNKYPLMYVESPGGSRIAQWIEVDNSAGLIHQSFKLSDEPEKGIYKIHVDSPEGYDSVTQTFKIEDYVLPRFEVTVIPPKIVYGDDEEFTFTVCAKYTYGQPVKGNVTLEVDNNGWGSSKTVHLVHEKISGCKDFIIQASEVALNSENFLAYNLEAKAKVLEDGTGKEYNGHSSISVERTPLKFKIFNDEKFIKPVLPYTSKIKVERPDGSVAADEELEVCVKGICKNMTTDSTGVLKFILYGNEKLPIQVKSLKYEPLSFGSNEPRSMYSWRRIMYTAQFSHVVHPYFSPSNSSLIIHAPSSTLPCKSGIPQMYHLPLLYAVTNQTSANITVQVVSRGQIQFSETKEYQLVSTPLPLDGIPLYTPPPLPDYTVQGSLTLELTLPPTASPAAKVIVWYTRKDGEVVSDTRELKVESCFNNPVSLEWSSLRSSPGEQVDIALKSEPHSICSLGVVDKSVELLSEGSDSITLNKVFELVSQAMVAETDNPQVNDQEYCQKKTNDVPDNTLQPIHHPYVHFSDYVDALKMFDDSGLFIFSDLMLESRPCSKRRVYTLWRSALMTPTIRGDKDHVLAVAKVEDQPEYLVYPVKDTEQAVRTYFPETWLWKLANIGESGVKNEQVTLPHTITEWVGKAVCVHHDKGLGVSNHATITTFTPFFIDLTLPPSVKRGEILSVKISVFNYLDADLPVKVVMDSSPEYDILEEKAEATVGTDHHHSSCIPAQEKVVQTFKIQPQVVGQVNLSVWAEVDSLYPHSCGPEYILNKRDHLIKPIKVEIEGFPKEKTWTKYICSKDIEENADNLEKWNIEVPSDIVPDSARGWMTAVGDLLGPTMKNLGSLVRMPYGCGEQNMLNFAPNIYVLQYLEASKQTSPEISGKSIEYMKQGYQRELQYRHSVGSYSAFGSSDPVGSTWLTGFVLKSFAQAQQFIMIDQDDINMSRDWLKLRQMENGCFESVGKVFHKDMKGGIDGNGSPVPLSSYILVAMLESGEPSTSRTVSEAAFCLVADKSVDPYTLALKSYALALADAPEAPVMVKQLIDSAVETSNSMSWDLPGKSKGVAVEVAGYAILAMTTIDPDAYDIQTRKIVKWISSQRNGQGGFISTQDTVVALQAMASFESHQKKGNPTDLIVSVFDGSAYNYLFHINETNKLLQQETPLPPLPTSLDLEFIGDGCALIQAILRYNIPEDEPTEAFTLTVDTRTEYDKACQTKAIKVCASYILPDKKSNMAVIEVNLVSGYIPEKKDLKRIVGYGTGLIKRYEVDGSQINFYVDEFSSQETCVDFGIIRQVEVEDVKPGTVRVYDYYQPEYFNTQSYTLPPNDECVVEQPDVIIDGIIVDMEMINEYDYNYDMP